jgi:hypothetical protein
MNRILREKQRVTVTHHQIWFPVYSPGHGYGFDCTHDYVVDLESLNAAARENYEMCMSKYSDIMQKKSWDTLEWESGEMLCDCGQKLKMYRPGADIDCDRCHRSYNSFGQLLAPRSQWGEETGETAFDYDRGFNDPEHAYDE